MARIPPAWLGDGEDIEAGPGEGLSTEPPTRVTSGK